MRPDGTLEDGDWVHPCKCKGSTQWVHQSCLLSWIKVQAKNIYHPSTTTTLTVEEASSFFESQSQGPDLPASSSNASLASTSSSGVDIRRLVNALGRRIRSFFFSDVNTIQICSSICCPQCKSPYVLCQKRSNSLISNLSGFIRYQNRVLLVSSLGVISGGIYLLLWTHGYSSLVALLGNEPTMELCLGEEAAHEVMHLEPTLADPSSLSLRPSSLLSILRANFYLVLAIPAVPFALSALSSYFPTVFCGYLYLFLGQVYIPASLSIPGSSLRMSTGYLKFAVPLAWLIYKKSMQAVCDYFSVKLDLLNPLDDASSDDDDDEDEDADSVDVEAEVAGSRGVMEELAASMSRESFASVADSRPPGSPSESPRESASGTPSVGPRDSLFFQTSLSAIASAIIFPYLTSLTSLLLLRLFRPSHLTAPKPLLFHLLGPVLRLITPRFLSAAYYRVSLKLHSTPWMLVNIFSAGLLITVKDLSQLLFQVERERLSKSRKVLNYPMPEDTPSPMPNFYSPLSHTSTL